MDKDRTPKISKDAIARKITKEKNSARKITKEKNNALDTYPTFQSMGNSIRMRNSIRSNLNHTLLRSVVITKLNIKLSTSEQPYFTEVCSNHKT